MSCCPSACGVCGSCGHAFCALCGARARDGVQRLRVVTAERKRHSKSRLRREEEARRTGLPRKEEARTWPLPRPRCSCRSTRTRTWRTTCALRGSKVRELLAGRPGGPPTYNMLRRGVAQAGESHGGIGALCTHAVVELYSEWCGPCKSVVPTFRRIRQDKDDESTLLFLAVRQGAHEQRVNAQAQLLRGWAFLPCLGDEGHHAMSARTTRARRSRPTSATCSTRPRTSRGEASRSSCFTGCAGGEGRCGWVGRTHAEACALCLRAIRCSWVNVEGVLVMRGPPARPPIQGHMTATPVDARALAPRGPAMPSLPQNGQLKAKVEGANTPALNSQILALTPANASMDDLEVRVRSSGGARWRAGQQGEQLVGEGMGPGRVKEHELRRQAVAELQKGAGAAAWLWCVVVWLANRIPPPHTHTRAAPGLLRAGKPSVPAAARARAHRAGRAGQGQQGREEGQEVMLRLCSVQPHLGPPSAFAGMPRSAHVSGGCRTPSCGKDPLQSSIGHKRARGPELSRETFLRRCQ